MVALQIDANAFRVDLVDQPVEVLCGFGDIHNAPRCYYYSMPAWRDQIATILNSRLAPFTLSLLHPLTLSQGGLLAAMIRPRARERKSFVAAADLLHHGCWTTITCCPAARLVSMSIQLPSHLN